MLTQLLAPISSGTALISKGQLARGLALFKSGSAAWQASGGRLGILSGSSVLAVAMAQLGDIDGALDLLEEGIGKIERPGWEERYYYAEALRTKGSIHERKGELTRAEHTYIASLNWARQQRAKSWELRTATSNARLMRDQGRIKEAYELLGPVYKWFTEGLDTPDLKDGKLLLDELQSLRLDNEACDVLWRR